MHQISSDNAELTAQQQSHKDLLTQSGLSGFYFIAACLLFILTEPLIQAELPTALVFLALICLSTAIRFYYYCVLPGRAGALIPLIYQMCLYGNALLWGLFSAWVISIEGDFGSLGATIVSATAAAAAGGIITLSMHKWLGLVAAGLFFLPTLVYLGLYRQTDNALLMTSLILLYIFFLYQLSKRLFKSYWQELHALKELKLKSRELEAARNQAVAINTALAAASKEALSADQAKTEFLAHMSHEIRTPLNGVIGMADMLATTPLDKRQHQYVNTILESGRLVINLINDILDFTQINSGKINISLQPVSVTGLAEDCIEMLQSQASKNQNTLVFQDNLPAHSLITTDRLRLQQLLTNLLNNALKFTHQGVVTLELFLREQPDGLILGISVSDTGIGIPADALGTIFNAFHQLNETAQPESTGTGLGLAICNKLVQLLRGEISVESVHGEGTCFTVQLPVDPPVCNTPKPVVKSLKKGHFQERIHNLLVVEDNRVNQLVIEAFLEKLGFQFTLATSGKEALAAYTENQPDLILMDLNLPDINGQQVTREIRQKEAVNGRKRSIIIALTAHAYANVALACEEAGMDGHVAKPLSLARLEQVLEHFLTDTYPHD